MSKNKKRIETMREKLKELRHKLSKSDLKKIKKHLYNIANKKELLESEITKEYFDELDKKKFLNWMNIITMMMKMMMMMMMMMMIL